MSIVEDDLQEPLLERLSSSPEPDATPMKKRKRGAEETTTKSVKKPKSKKSKAVEEDELDIEAGINNAFSHMDSQLLADYIAQRTRKYEDELSSIELEDKYIPGAFQCFSFRFKSNECDSKCDRGYHVVG